MSEKEKQTMTNWRTTPSQAEGNRQTVDEDLCAKGLQTENCPEGSLEEEEPDGMELPSQAEGDREFFEEEGEGSGAAPSQPGEELPSQAEGSRETVEQDLKEKEGSHSSGRP